jgi:TIR domain
MSPTSPDNGGRLFCRGAQSLRRPARARARGLSRSMRAEGGRPLIKNLEAGLTSSQTGVLVWSSATADSDWVFREYSTMEARTTKKPGFQFVPVRLDASELPSFATTRVFLDFSTYPDGPNGGELLRLLHAMVGQPLSPEAAHFANVQDEASKLAAAQIAAAIKQGRPDRLMQLFSDDGPPWQTSSALGCKAAEGLTRLGRNDEAIQMLDALEKDFPKAIRPKQLRALALARRAQRRRKAGDAAYEKDLMAAQDIVGVLYESGERDPETLGIYGRTWMDRYDVSGDLADLRQSRDPVCRGLRGCSGRLLHRHQRRVEERLTRQSGGAGQRRRLRPPRARDRRHQQASERLLEDRDGSGGFPHSARFREGGRALRRGRGDGPEGGRLAPDHLDPSFASAGKTCTERRGARFGAEAIRAR